MVNLIIVNYMEELGLHVTVTRPFDEPKNYTVHLSENYLETNLVVVERDTIAPGYECEIEFGSPGIGFTIDDHGLDLNMQSGPTGKNAMRIEISDKDEPSA